MGIKQEPRDYCIDSGGCEPGDSQGGLQWHSRKQSISPISVGGAGLSLRLCHFLSSFSKARGYSRSSPDASSVVGAVATGWGAPQLLVGPPLALA